MTTDAAPVRARVEAGIATLTLDAPHNRNALSGAMVTALRSALAEAADDGAVRAVVLTHAGGTFCSGADLTQARRGSMTTGARQLLELLRAIVELPKPVVAKITGHVRAGGTGIIGACDIAIAGPRATFAFSESRIGLAPAVISLTTQARLAERAVGRYYLTGEVFGSAEAARIGLVTTAVDDDAALDVAVNEVTSALLLASPQGLRESKALATGAMLRRMDRDGEAMVERSARLFGSAEAREGMAAFLERRPASWAPGEGGM